MFQDACQSLLNSMLPIILPWRLEGGRINCSIGAGVVLNDEGWLLTAGHFVAIIDMLRQGKDPVKPNRKITNHSLIFGQTRANLIQGVFKPHVDIGAVKLDWKEKPDGIDHVRLRKTDVQQGELFCRAGFPFADKERRPKLNDGKFVFDNLFPIPIFANEAFVSRFIDVVVDNVYIGSWFETSSPGLRGQSGGPLLDSDGYVCGIQVNTSHYRLDFEVAGKNQVLNVGRAVRIDTIRSFLDENQIKYHD